MSCNELMKEDGKKKGWSQVNLYQQHWLRDTECMNRYIMIQAGRFDLSSSVWFKLNNLKRGFQFHCTSFRIQICPIKNRMHTYHWEGSSSCTKLQLLYLNKRPPAIAVMKPVHRTCSSKFMGGLKSLYTTNFLPYIHVGAAANCSGYVGLFLTGARPAVCHQYSLAASS